jgi:regulator of replication initiation timing
MKLQKFLSLKEKACKLTETNGLTVKTNIILINEYEYDQLDSENIFEDETVNEAAKDIWKNIKGLFKLNSLEKRYIKAMVDEGAAELDYARRVKASDSKEETEQLRQAHKLKMDALTDKAKAVADAIDDIATTDWLKTKTKTIKIKARIAKNNILIKISSKEEAKELGLKNAELNQELTTAQNELREYEKDKKDEIKDAFAEKKEEIKAKIEDINNKLKDNQKAILDAEGKTDESTIYEESKFELLGKLKQERAVLKSSLLKLKQEFNQYASDNEKYNVEEDEKDIEKLASDAKEYIEKAKEEPADEEPAKEEPAKEEPAKDKKAELKDRLGKLQDKLKDIDETDPENDDKVKEIESKIAAVQQQLSDLNKKKDESLEEAELLTIEAAISEIEHMISSLSSKKFFTFNTFLEKRNK